MNRGKIMKWLTIIFVVLFLTGCGGLSTENIDVTTKPIEREKLIIDPLPPLHISKPVPQQITVNENKEPIVILSWDSYEKLGINISQMYTWMNQCVANINAYRDYYEN